VKPIVTEEQYAEAQKVCAYLLESLSSVSSHASMAGLAMALVFAADASKETPLESVFQMMRQFRKAFQTMQKQLNDARAQGLLPSAESKFITPNQAGSRLVLP
jgi:hypothetical protein